MATRMGLVFALFASACAVNAGTGIGDDDDDGSGSGSGSGGNPAPRLKAISAGSEMTCAVLEDSTIRCWGRNNEGQLGNGTTSNGTTVHPVEVKGIADAVAVSAGVEYACALRASGTVACWGSGASGLLGNGTDEDKLSPTDIAGLTGVKEIATGFASTCALLTDGTVSCWGRGGELGNPNVQSSFVPVPVAGLTGVAHLTGANELGTSLRSMTCAQHTNGTLDCWSTDNVNGQLGNGTQDSSRTPAPVSGINDATAITASLLHACAVRADGTYCWGASGLVGDSTLDQRNAPTKVSSTKFVEISSGFEHTCGRDAGGGVSCWGSNSNGQSGDGQPIQVTDRRLVPTTSLVSNVALISAGMSHTCAYTTAGKTLCWGRNAYGELGSGQPALGVRNSTPTLVEW